MSPCEAVKMHTVKQKLLGSHKINRDRGDATRPFLYMPCIFVGENTEKRLPRSKGITVVIFLFYTFLNIKISGMTASMSKPIRFLALEL